MGYQAVLALLVDGARADVLTRLVTAGELPTLKRHFADAGGLATATSVFPTVSGPAHLPLLAGVHPGTANLPGIRWAERPTAGRGSFLGRTRSYMAPFRALKLERDVPPSVRTLFAHVANMADVNTWFVRGCPNRARRTRWSKPVAFLRALLTRQLAVVGRAGRSRPAPRDRAWLHVGARRLSRHRRAGPSLRSAVRRLLPGLPRLRSGARPHPRRPGPRRPRRRDADRDLVGPRPDRDPHPRRHRQGHRQGLSAHRGLSQVLALSAVRRGRGHGVGQLDGQRLRAWRRRLARAARFREAGLARAGAARHLRRASGRRARHLPQRRAGPLRGRQPWRAANRGPPANGRPADPHCHLA